jgi:hypothetical protein
LPFSEQNYRWTKNVQRFSSIFNSIFFFKTIKICFWNFSEQNYQNQNSFTLLFLYRNQPEGLLAAVPLAVWPVAQQQPQQHKTNAAAQALSRGGPCRTAGPALTTTLPAHQAPTWAWAGKVPPHLG